MAKRDKKRRPKHKVPVEATSSIGNVPSKTMPKLEEEGIHQDTVNNLEDTGRFKDPRWTFSFEFWIQRRLFGLDHENVSTKWFVTLLKSLKDLSSKTIKEVMQDPSSKKAYRLHSIRWGHRCPIPEKDFLEQLPPKYRQKETEIVQLGIEKSKGRIIGFLDAKNVFQVVLLDPAHNMQLTKDNQYTTVKTKILPDSYDNMVTKIKAISEDAEKLNPDGTGAHEFIQSVRKILQDEEFASKQKFIAISEDMFDDINEILQEEPDHDSLDFLILSALEHYKNFYSKSDQPRQN